jgi:hypothetical protein
MKAFNNNFNHGEKMKKIKKLLKMIMNSIL